jgi:catechol 2,3-dioxygenase-like lactoylglutathione lyase family enzyme
MEPRVHVITLAVDDLQRALAFYRDGLGFTSAVKAPEADVLVAKKRAYWSSMRGPSLESGSQTARRQPHLLRTHPALSPARLAATRPVAFPPDRDSPRFDARTAGVVHGFHGFHSRSELVK